jgi:addiction module HigA family antidote
MTEDILTEKIKPVHPGEVLLEEFLKPWEMSQNQLANAMGVTVSLVNEIVRGRRGITGDMALRLSRVTGTTPEFWLNLQSLYDLKFASHRGRQDLEVDYPDSINGIWWA